MVSEENKANETSPAQGATGRMSAQEMEAFREAYKQRWAQRMQIIAAVVAAFLLYMIWFMMHE